MSEDEVTPKQALATCLMLLDIELLDHGRGAHNTYGRELHAIRRVILSLKDGVDKMDNKFFTRTKVMPELPDNVRTMLDQLAGGLTALKEKLAVVEARLTALENPQEEKAKKNGHRSFQADISAHTRRVAR